eukprot:4436953-Pyramimonas_sp.AAC.1
MPRRRRIVVTPPPAPPPPPPSYSTSPPPVRASWSRIEMSLSRRSSRLSWTEARARMASMMR